MLTRVKNDAKTDFKKSILDFKKELDLEIERFFDMKIAELSGKDEWIVDGLRYVKKLVLAGGKRIRPALLYWGYKSQGGDEEEKIMKVAVAIELVHIFLLIHDDIIDLSEKRHGVKSLHVWFEEFAKEKFPEKDWQRFGSSMALVFGDIINAFSIELILEAGFDNEKMFETLNRVQKIISNTCIGEAQDVHIEFSKNFEEEKVLEMYENKTAKYTIEGPLHVGAILGGADENVLKEFSKFAIPLGIAFQVQDDILGVFGDEEKIGKSAVSDVTEGKKTILVTKALDNANEKQRERINQLLGKKDITMDELKEFRNILVDSKALEYAQEYTKEQISKSKEVLNKMNIDNESKLFLEGMADYMLNREV